MSPDAAERMRVYQQGRRSASDDSAVCPYGDDDWRVLTWIKGRQAAQNYWREIEEIENRIAEQQQAEPVAVQYIALCDAMRYSERKDESFSPEEHAESLVAEIDRLKQQAEPVVEPVVWDPQCPLCGGSRQAALAQQAEPVALTLRDLLITAAATAVAAERKGTYRGAAWVADSVLEEHPQQAEPVIDDDGNSSF